MNNRGDFNAPYADRNAMFYPGTTLYQSRFLELAETNFIFQTVHEDIR